MGTGRGRGVLDEKYEQDKARQRHGSDQRARRGLGALAADHPGAAPLDAVVLQTAFGTPDEDRYPAHDHLYSTVCVFGAAGVVAEYVEYDAYGRARYHVAAGADGTWLTADDNIADESAVGNPVGFTGQRLDVLDNGDLRLMSYKNRVYDPDTGRFLQRDPYGVGDSLFVFEHDPDGVVGARPFAATMQYGANDHPSLYQYVLHNPQMDVDSEGLFVHPVDIVPPERLFGDSMSVSCCLKWIPGHVAHGFDEDEVMKCIECKLKGGPTTTAVDYALTTAAAAFAMTSKEAKDPRTGVAVLLAWSVAKGLRASQCVVPVCVRSGAWDDVAKDCIEMEEWNARRAAKAARRRQQPKQPRPPHRYSKPRILPPYYPIFDSNDVSRG